MSDPLLMFYDFPQLPGREENVTEERELATQIGSPGAAHFRK